MSVGLLWAWIVANQASLATILFILSELAGSIPQVKANGFLSFAILQLQKVLKDKGGQDLTP